MIRKIMFSRDIEEVAMGAIEETNKRSMGPQYAVMYLLNDLTSAGGST